MAKRPCKGIRKDGRPCRGHGLDKYNGYCSVHGPLLFQAGAGRVPGGNSSAGAARRDESRPEWLKELHELHGRALSKLEDGSLSPEAYASVCRGIKLKLDIYRRAADEMSRDRAAKRRSSAANPGAGAPQAAAATPGDAGADQERLEAVLRITGRQDRYRSQSLLPYDVDESSDPDASNNDGNLSDSPGGE